MHLADCSYVTLRNLQVEGFPSNGINVDDGGSFLAAQSFFNGTFSYSVPAGHYQVTALIVTGSTPADVSFTFVTAPEVTVNAIACG